MFYIKKRKEEIVDRINKGGNLFKIAADIISQEKLMIEQAKKEAREEFVEKLIDKIYYVTTGYDRSRAVYWIDIDKLLKEYEVAQ
jgi:hypothetical protein